MFHQPGQSEIDVEGLLVAPQRRERRLLEAALDGAGRDGGAVLEGRHADLGAVPRHARVVPLDPGQVPAARGRCGGGVEVGAGDELADRAGVVGGAAVEGDGDDGPPDARGVVGGGFPGGLGVLGVQVGRGDVALADAPDLRAVGGQDEVGVAQPRRHGRLGGQRVRLRVTLVEPVQALVVVVGEDQGPAGGGAHRKVGAPAVLVDAGAGVPGRLQQLGAVTAFEMDDRGTPALLGPGLLPPHVAAHDGGEAETEPGAGDIGRGDG